MPAKSARYSLLRPWRQRSHIVQSWLHAAGIDYPLVEGGYKALRQTAIQATIELAQKPIVLIGGCTGQR